MTAQPALLPASVADLMDTLLARTNTPDVALLGCLDDASTLIDTECPPCNPRITP